jgi:hypothetical protein
VSAREKQAQLISLAAPIQVDGWGSMNRNLYEFGRARGWWL